VTIDQLLGYVFSVAAQFGIDNGIKAAIVLLLGALMLVLFLRR